MAIEVWLWLVANTLSLIVSGKDLRGTYAVWERSRRTVSTGGFRRLANRNLRASLFKFLMASAFLLGGVTSVILDNRVTVLFLVLGSLLLTTDVVWESKYRSNLFKSAQEKAERERKSKRENGTRGGTPPV